MTSIDNTFILRVLEDDDVDTITQLCTGGLYELTDEGLSSLVSLSWHGHRTILLPRDRIHRHVRSEDINILKKVRIREPDKEAKADSPHPHSDITKPESVTSNRRKQLYTNIELKVPYIIEVTLRHGASTWHFTINNLPLLGRSREIAGDYGLGASLRKMRTLLYTFQRHKGRALSTDISRSAYRIKYSTAGDQLYIFGKGRRRVRMSRTLMFAYYGISGTDTVMLPEPGSYSIILMKELRKPPERYRLNNLGSESRDAELRLSLTRFVDTMPEDSDLILIPEFHLRSVSYEERGAD